jgi:hypothetical protein
MSFQFRIVSIDLRHFVCSRSIAPNLGVIVTRLFPSLTMSNHVLNHPTKRQSTLNHMPSGDENSIESVFTVYPREPASSENELRFSLAKTETRAIRYLKLVVIGVLILAAIALSYVTSLLISKTEHDLFTSSFTNDANRLKVATYDVMLQRISVSAALIIRYLMQAGIQGQDPVDTKLIGMCE